jgi:DNA-binding CsgD family transcriptional regulator
MTLRVPPQPGDELFIARSQGGAISEAFQRSPGEPFVEITNEVGRVDLTSESIHVTGRQVFPTVEPWSVSCDRNEECTDTLLRGTVRMSSAPWHDECRARIDMNMARFQLSPREREVAWLLLSHGTGADIAETVGISRNTYFNHVKHIRLKLGFIEGDPLPCRLAIVERLLDLEGLVNG